MAPTDFSCDEAALERFRLKMLDMLSDVDGASGPALDLCIKSYIKMKKNEPCGVPNGEERRYSIIDTELVLQQRLSQTIL